LIHYAFIFGIYLPADGLIHNYRQELNALDDLHAYYINYGNVIVAEDLNASCINKNLKLTNTIIIVQTDSLSVLKRFNANVTIVKFCLSKGSYKLV
jgi:hypothetical protein